MNPTIRLKNHERALLSYLEMDANLNIELLAKKLKVKPYQLRYSLNNLIASGLIKKNTIINVKSLGYKMRNIYFSLAAGQMMQNNNLLREIKNSAETTWLAEFTGDYQYALGLCLSEADEVRNYIDKLSQKFGRVFYEKQISSQYASIGFAKKYLSPAIKQTKSFNYHGEVSFVEIDELDKKILAFLVNQPEASSREQAKLLAIPQSTYQLRVKKLEKQKVISGYVYNVDYQMLGILQYKLLLYIKGYSRLFRESLYKWCLAHRNVTLLVECLGSWDFEINLEVETQTDLVLFMQELYEKFGADLLYAKTLSKIRDLKFKSIPDLAI